jgi:hypothetical protein
MGRGVFRIVESFLEFFGQRRFTSCHHIIGFGVLFHILHIACAILAAHASYCFVVVDLPSDPVSLKRAFLYLHLTGTVLH